MTKHLGNKPDNMGVVERIDELIAEAEKEPSWTAIQALRCLRKELLACGSDDEADKTGS